jgi:ABC-2 type transport system permease protein
MWTVLGAEARKLHRSLALLLAVAAPLMVGLFTFFSILRRTQPQPWDIWLSQSSAIWAFFMLPMSVTALTALVAHMEHSARAWDHLRALPRARWNIYAAKALCVLVLVAAMSFLSLIISYGAAAAASAIRPGLAPEGDPALATHASTMARIWLASLLLTAIQFWTAIRFQSFVPALSLGIGGTFFSVVATSAKEGIYFPWQMPVNMLATDPERAGTALALGCGLGSLILILAVIHLSAREA